MKPLKDFEIKREAKAGVEVLRLVGPVDDYTLNSLQGVLQVLQQGNHHRVVVNCENLDYMSTAGIRALVDFARHVREAKGDLILVKVSDKIQRITKVLGYSSEFKVIEEEADAIKALTPEEPKKAEP